ncbi:NAD(P)/FAD-dependent oxidoreductase [Hoyosella rhizosphaerae]|uniref:Baeyer-Villiger monooxygenase n=1 Tax=Hoyosella rhizosphaerae TaxID=1755582 RepID=A0A916XAC0_9ACTN|nr:NAD(P)/FAD-dependent oxidoreductase [Hoyosella rhizosphaerae]MBN4926526.1 NAD(P)/FAD-dependent oxidoreductase [Hoyosella rhizosphaerae]GGC58579.1 Baeyer-Villiger monooxygenase [Hoyosella rhizosphaerae]
MTTPPPITPLPPHTHVLIAGAGFSGLGAAIRLTQSGFTDFVILEKADDVGGTWQANSYPGCACDVPSVLYSYSFAQNPNWSSSFSPQPEIYAYLQRTAREYGIMPKVRLSTTLDDAAWDDKAKVWRFNTSAGQLTADIFINATGPLSEVSIPTIPGTENFAGEMFHSAQWNHEYDLQGKRVAVIGTGASAIQFVPEIQPSVASMILFQRTAPWILPRRDRKFSDLEKSLFRRIPLLQRLARYTTYWYRESYVIGFTKIRSALRIAEAVGRYNIRRQVKDKELRKKLTPSFQLGCKRVLMSNNYYATLDKPNTDVTTAGIARITENSVVATDGVEYPVDCIIWGTGFHVTDTAIAQHVRGRTGKTLEETWRGSPEAYLGITVADFPNYFHMVGPNTGLGHSSIVFIIEAQLRYIVDAIKYVNDNHLAAIEPLPEAQDEWVELIEQKSAGTVWLEGGCNSWYLDEKGRNSTLWPGYTFTYRKLTAKADPEKHFAEAQARS